MKEKADKLRYCKEQDEREEIGVRRNGTGEREKRSEEMIRNTIRKNKEGRKEQDEWQNRVVESNIEQSGEMRRNIMSKKKEQVKCEEVGRNILKENEEQCGGGKESDEKERRVRTWEGKG